MRREQALAAAQLRRQPLERASGLDRVEVGDLSDDVRQGPAQTQASATLEVDQHETELRRRVAQGQAEHEGLEQLRLAGPRGAGDEHVRPVGDEVEVDRCRPAGSGGAAVAGRTCPDADARDETGVAGRLVARAGAPAPADRRRVVWQAEVGEADQRRQHRPPAREPTVPGRGARCDAPGLLLDPPGPRHRDGDRARPTRPEQGGAARPDAQHPAAPRGDVGRVLRHEDHAVALPAARRPPAVRRGTPRAAAVVHDEVGDGCSGRAGRSVDGRGWRCGQDRGDAPRVPRHTRPTRPGRISEPAAPRPVGVARRRVQHRERERSGAVRGHGGAEEPVHGGQCCGARTDDGQPGAGQLGPRWRGRHPVRWRVARVRWYGPHDRWHVARDRRRGLRPCGEADRGGRRVVRQGERPRQRPVPPTHREQGRQRGGDGADGQDERDG